MIGRAADSDLVLGQPSISRHHCRVQMDSERQVIVSDLGSRNGTEVNGRKVAGGQFLPLSDGDRLRIGDVEATVTFVSERDPKGDRTTTGQVLHAPGRWTLEVCDSAERFDLNPQQLTRKGIVVGRRLGKTDLTVRDPSVSGIHCELALDGNGRLTLEDLNSSNGTFVDGRKIAPGTPVSVTEQSVVELGTCRVALIAASGTAASGQSPVLSEDETLAVSEKPGLDENATLAFVNDANFRGVDEETIVNVDDETLVNAGDETISDVGDETISDVGDETIADVGDETIADVGDETIADVGDETIIESSSGHADAPLAPSQGDKRAKPAKEAEKADKQAESAPVSAELNPRPGGTDGDYRPGRGNAVFALLKSMTPTLLVCLGLSILLVGPEWVDFLASGLAITILVLVAVFLITLVTGEWQRLRHAAKAQQMELEALRLATERDVEQARLVASQSLGAWSGFRKFRVAKKQPECEDVCSFYLVPHDGKPFPTYQAGQHLTFQLKIPEIAKPVTRCYTLSESPTETDYYRVTIKKVPDGLASRFFHERINEGDILDVRSPSGKFHLDLSEARPIVLIGSGIGLTPALSMANAIAATGGQRETWLFYGVRDGRSHAMKDHLQALADAHPNIRLHIVYSRPREGIDFMGRDYDHAGRIDLDLLKRELPSNGFEFYLCGPPAMMNALVPDLEDWGVPAGDVHFEAFGPASVKRAATAQPTTTVSSKVTFAKSGLTVDWTGDHVTLLELAESKGVALDSGCRAGSCGTCVSAIKSGKVKYVEQPGVPPENGSCLACIAVPDGDLALDI
ncbi:MAG: FHA domain-containing protein [Magnetovibrionaceae bacterium]